MIRAVYYLVFIKIMGWRIEGDFPKIKKYLIVVAPHTSNWDFPIGVFTRSIKRLKANFIAKKELFVFPFGYFFRYMGGYAVDRKKHRNFVDATLAVIEREDQFAVAITPEGTRSFNDKWKTGFYFIAIKADIPVVKVALDYVNKRVVISEPEPVKGTLEECISTYKQYFSQFKGKYPEKGVIWEE